MNGKQAYRLAVKKQELDTLLCECVDILKGSVRPLKDIVIELNKNLTGEDTDAQYNNGCKFLDDILSDNNIIEDNTLSKGYTYKYDVRVSGTYYGKYTTAGYKGEPERKDYYKESILDKFHKLISLMYYIHMGLPMDYTPNLPTPCSACDLADSYWLTGEETDTDEEY